MDSAGMLKVVPPGAIDAGPEDTKVMVGGTETEERGAAVNRIVSVLSGKALQDQCNDVVAAFEGVSCGWEAVLDVLQENDATGEVIAEVLRRSALKLGFWEPDAKLLAAAQQEVQGRLAKHQQSSAEEKDPKERLPSRRPSKDAQQAGVHKVEDPPPPRKSSKTRKESKHSTGSFFKPFGRQISPTSQGTTDTMHLTGAASGLSLVSYSIPPVPEAAVSKAKELVKAEKLLVSNSAASRLRQFKWALFFFVTFQMIIFAVYVVFYMTPKTWDVIGLPILIARGSAYGACFWTGVLFLTMSRDLISFVTRFSCVRNSQIAMQLINCHKELHIFSAYEVLLDGCLHALMHHIGTFVALEMNDTRTLNSMLVCAQDKSAMPSGYIGKFIGNFLKAFQYPRCPLPEDAEVGYFDGVFSTPGITGYLLLAVIFALGWFSRTKKRRANFRLFFALHHLLVPCWVILLILHGANDWVGLGFPLAILVAGIPVVAYAWTRLRRVYLSCRHDARVLRAEKSTTGKLLRLDVELMPAYRTCKVGEFAYVNVAGAGATEWHPYTISKSCALPNGLQEVTFCMMAVGKWTNKVHALFGDHIGRDEMWPKVYIDGPFYAPTVSMPSRSTVVGIGAGVGVTPFLSFLGSMAGDAGTEHKNAHVFWMSAFATDFMLFKDLLSALDKRGKAKTGTTTSFHLHATPRFGAWDGKGLGSVFELAAREVWASWLKRLDAKLPQKEPSFSKYKNPLHAVVSHNILESGRPLAVAVGSPDWMVELLAIGEADIDEDVFVYFCGNDFLKNMIQSACIACNEVRAGQNQRQRYYFYFERFG